MEKSRAGTTSQLDFKEEKNWSMEDGHDWFLLVAVKLVVVSFAFSGVKLGIIYVISIFFARHVFSLYKLLGWYLMYCVVT